MDISLITARKNRPEANRTELESLILQKDIMDFEVIVLDDSTTADTPLVFREYSDRLNIVFMHFDGWKTANVYCTQNGRTSFSVHYNRGIKVAKGSVIVLSFGEMVHCANSLREMYIPHTKYPDIVWNGPVKDAPIERFSDGIYNASKAKDSDEWVVPRCWDGDGVVFTSIRKSNLLRVHGFDERFMDSFDCEDEELSRRLKRSGMTIAGGNDLIAFHLSHSRKGRWSNPADFRASQRSKIRKDAGYANGEHGVKYYRPGSEYAPIVANTNGWGQLPETVQEWTLDETIENFS